MYKIDNYVSPRSLNKSLSFNLATYYNKRFDSKISISNSYYNFAQNTSEYYQKQTIEQFGLGFSYKPDTFIDKTGVKINYTTAVGTNKYHQTGIKVFTKFLFKNDLTLNVSYNYNNKVQSSQKYYNSTFKANLSYRF